MAKKAVAIKSLYKKYFAPPPPLLRPPEEEHVNVITVNDIISKASFFYEKIRNALEYSEEHLLRKNAIARILSRRLFFQTNTKEVAESLIMELIRARYLPNKTLSEKIIPVIADVIEKYHVFLDLIERVHGTRKRQKMFKWVMHMAASELEAKLSDPYKDEAIAEYMFEIIMKNLPEELKKIQQEELSIQLYIAIQRALLKADNALINYRIFINNFPQWRNADVTYIRGVVHQLDHIIETVNGHMRHKQTDALYRWSKKYSVIFIILRDLLETHQEDFASLLNDPDTLKEEIDKAYEARLQIVRKKIRRGVMRSIVYIFFTKMLIALLLEIPYDRYVHGEVLLMPLEINILFPPLLMFIMGITIRYPSKENLDKISESLQNMIYHDDLSLKPPRRIKKSGILYFFISFLYILTYGFSFGAIAYGLHRLEFNLFSGLLFVLFLTLASFLGFRLRQPIKEISLIERRENIISAFVGFLTTPFLRVGRWIATKFSRINLILFVLDVLIEAPFQLVVEVLEQWFSYMKEKKDELS